MELVSGLLLDCLAPFKGGFFGLHPDDIFCRQVSVDIAELLIVFGTIAVSLGLMVAFGNWWSR